MRHTRVEEAIFRCCNDVLIIVSYEEGEKDRMFEFCWSRVGRNAAVLLSAGAIASGCAPASRTGESANLAGLVSAIAAVATVGLAVVAVYVEGRRIRLTRSAELLLQLEDRFDSTTLRDARAGAAKAMLDRIVGRDARADVSAVDDVLDFFDTIGLLVRKRALDREMAWHSFEYWIRYYLYIYREHVTERQEREPAQWREAIDMVAKLARIGSDFGDESANTLSRHRCEEFLRDEAALLPYTPTLKWRGFWARLLCRRTRG